MMTNDGKEMEMIETDFKIDSIKKMPRILQNRVKA